MKRKRQFWMCWIYWIMLVCPPFCVCLSSFHITLTERSLFVLGSVFSQAMKKWVQGSSDQVRLQDAKVSKWFSRCMRAWSSIVSQVLHSQLFKASTPASLLCSDAGTGGDGVADRQDDRQRRGQPVQPLQPRPVYQGTRPPCSSSPCFIRLLFLQLHT